jgi:RHS repeat-associated protein
VTSGGVTTWVYDAASQLVAEWHEVGLIATWTYDGAGNRLSQDRLQGGVRTVTGYAFDRANQIVTMTEGGLTTTFTFDQSGNARSEETISGARTTYSWSPQERLLLVEVTGGVPATYSYRYDGLLATANQGEGALDQIWDLPGPTGYGDLFEEIDGSDVLKRAYYRATRLATQKEVGATVFVAAEDHLGSVQLLTDAAQAVAGSYRYSAWGERLSTSGTADGPLAWQGEWGYYRGSGRRTWIRARHLLVGLGRWSNPDPAGTVDGGNEYLYVGNGPERAVDPSGLRIRIVGGDAKYQRTVQQLLAQIRNGGPAGKYLLNTLEASRHTVSIGPLQGDIKDPSTVAIESEERNQYLIVDKALVDGRTSIEENLNYLFSILANTRGIEGLIDLLRVGKAKGARRGAGCSSLIYFDPLQSRQDVATKPQALSPPVIILAHELAHALHMALGTVPRFEEYKNEELAASRYENLIRAELKLGQRVKYGPWLVNPIFGERTP